MVFYLMGGISPFYAHHILCLPHLSTFLCPLFPYCAPGFWSSPTLITRLHRYLSCCYYCWPNPPGYPERTSPEYRYCYACLFFCPYDRPGYIPFVAGGSFISPNPKYL